MRKPESSANQDTLILCINLRGARQFRLRSGDQLSFERELRRPRIQLRNADFPDDSDLPEVTGDPVLINAEETIARHYARHLARRLNVDHRNREFGSLILCAEPRLLGIVIAALSDDVRQVVSGIVEQDLYDVNESDLMTYIQDLKSHPHLTGAA